MKLALIGKNIAHSRSPEVYKKILGEKFVSCELLDYQDEKNIPKLTELFKYIDGVSVTSPYKKHFLSQVELVSCPPIISGINCIRFFKNKAEGTNTDFLAIKEIITSLKWQLADKEIVILGDGVMSKITELALFELNFPYKIYARKITKDFNQLIFKNALVINTCSRDYVFNGKIENKVIFWDYNYNFLPHQNTLPRICEQYIDGFSLLELQAMYAVKFFQNVTV
jgi:shikimate dehydrogenase